eukprot:12926432-Prorocentrum_lima.AAC.1
MRIHRNLGTPVSAQSPRSSTWCAWLTLPPPPLALKPSDMEQRQQCKSSYWLTQACCQDRTGLDRVWKRTMVS